MSRRIPGGGAGRGRGGGRGRGKRQGKEGVSGNTRKGERGGQGLRVNRG